MIADRPSRQSFRMANNNVASCRFHPPAVHFLKSSAESHAVFRHRSLDSPSHQKFQHVIPKSLGLNQQFRRRMRDRSNTPATFTDWQNGPPLTALGEDGIQVALEDGAGIMEVLFGVGFGGGDALKRLVQNADNPPLFGERGHGNLQPVLTYFC